MIRARLLNLHLSVYFSDHLSKLQLHRGDPSHEEGVIKSLYPHGAQLCPNLACYGLYFYHLELENNLLLPIKDAVVKLDLRQNLLYHQLPWRVILH